MWWTPRNISIVCSIWTYFNHASLYIIVYHCIFAIYICFYMVLAQRSLMGLQNYTNHLQMPPQSIWVCICLPHRAIRRAIRSTLVGIILYLICILVVYTSRSTTFDLSTIRCSEVVVTPASQRRRRDTSYWNKLPECHCVILHLMICSAHTCVLYLLSLRLALHPHEHTRRRHAQIFCFVDLLLDLDIALCFGWDVLAHEGWVLFFQI